MAENNKVKGYAFFIFQVADLFRDPSIGAKINIEVSKLMLLHSMPVSQRGSFTHIIIPFILFNPIPPNVRKFSYVQSSQRNLQTGR